MPKGIIRIPEDLKLSTVLLDALAQRFPEYTLETYSSKPDYQKSYGKRVNILFQAFEFMLKAYPRPVNHSFLTDEILLEYARQCQKAYVGKGNAAELQKELEDFTAKIITLIGLAWDKSGSQAAELLNEAEQYVIMAEGRGDLVTITPMDLGEKAQYVLQLDETIPPHYDLVLQELTQIKLLGYPKTPAWFKGLMAPENHFMQSYFCHLSPHISDLAADFEAFCDAWKEVKSSYEASKEFKPSKLQFDLKLIAQRSSPLAPWFEKLPIHQQEMLRGIATEPIKSIDKKLEQLKAVILRQEYKDSLEQIRSIPQWYWVLESHQQYFLQHVLSHANTIEEAVSFLSSRQRTLPMPANFAAHSLHLVKENGDLQSLYVPKYRSSHIATRDGIEWPDNVQRRHVIANLAKVMSKAKKEQVVLFQTLISPVGTDKVATGLSSIIPDFKLDQLARLVVSEDTDIVPSIIQTNHPLNIAKYFLYTAANNSDSLALIAAAKNFIPTVPGLLKLIKSYTEVLNSRRFSATVKDTVGRELFLSSLEQLIILTIAGYSYGSCVSGKDRKAIEIIHTDAMFLYKEKYNVWPEFEDTPLCRANFVSLVADLYISRHQHEHAGQNASGSDGVKTPDMYFPADIAAEINRRLERLGINNSLSIDNRMATNNEVNKIVKGSTLDAALSEESNLLCQLLAKRLGEKACQELYDALYLLCSDMSLFKPQEGGWLPLFFLSGKEVPTGIKKIKDLMDDRNSGPDNITRMTGIFSIIMERPESDSSRTEATVSVYNGLRRLLKPGEWDDASTGQTPEVLAGKIAKEWYDIFHSAQKLHSQTSEFAPH